MATKQQPGAHDCYAKALPDEPMFVLLARDATAPALVMMWAQQRSRDIDRGEKPASDAAGVTGALDCAHAMLAWRRDNEGKWREAPTAEVAPQTEPDESAEYLDIVFTVGVEGVSTLPSYMEVVTPAGALKVGRWVRRDDGNMAFRIPGVTAAVIANNIGEGK